MKAMAQIFLSYAREDEEKVENLCQKLSDAGFDPWMDKKDILPGETWENSVQRAIERSDFVLVCLSANSVTKRGFLQKEINLALDIWQEKLEDDIYLIPVRLEDCEVPEKLRDFQWVDLFEEDGWSRLVKAIRVGMERREETVKLEQESDRAQLQPRRPFTGKSIAKPLTVIAAIIALVVILVYLWTQKRSDVFDMWKAVLAMVVGIALDVIANYIYDLLQARHRLPDSSSLKGALLVFLFFIPLALLTLLSQPDVTPAGANRNPLIKSIAVNPEIIEVGQNAIVTVNAVDPDNDPLTYVWTVSNGKIVEAPTQQSTVTYEAPDIPGDVVLRVIARDGKGGETEQRRSMSIVMPSTAP